ncbi:MAG: hypothetical protein P8I99_14135 [Acidimicrobiales bacterium]|nr:hypothetical protein [Acidimicrobiales bacterium]
MDLHAAIAALGLSGSPPWSEIRRAHRAAIRRAHPDVGGDPVHAAKINQAFDALHAATKGGTITLPNPAPPLPAAPAASSPRRMVDRDDPTEILLRLSDAAHDIGDVVFIDPVAGLMEVVVGDAPAVGQLTIHVGASELSHDGVPVAFTLDALGVTPAPLIHDVVDDLMRRYRNRKLNGA